MIRRRAARLWFGALALACGPGDEPPAMEATRDVSVPAAPGAARVIPPVIAVPLPAPLASACIAGDPELGLPWSLRAATDSALAVIGLEALAARDSARLVARIARTVDVLPSDTSLADFRGLPVVVRAAWRLAPVEGDTIVVALVARRLPLESSPLEEVFTIVAAPGQRQGVPEPLLEGWSARDVGAEETLPMRELAGAFGAGATVRLVLVHEAPDGLRAELLAREDGRWAMAWQGLVPRCDPR